MKRHTWPYCLHCHDNPELDADGFPRSFIYSSTSTLLFHSHACVSLSIWASMRARPHFPGHTETRFTSPSKQRRQCRRGSLVSYTFSAELIGPCADVSSSCFNIVIRLRRRGHYGQVLCYCPSFFFLFDSNFTHLSINNRISSNIRAVVVFLWGSRTEH